MGSSNRGTSSDEGVPTWTDTICGDGPLLHQGIDRGGSSIFALAAQLTHCMTLIFGLQYVREAQGEKQELIDMISRQVGIKGRKRQRYVANKERPHSLLGTLTNDEGATECSL